MDLVSVLTRLSLAHGPAGAEDQARELACELLSPFMDEVRVDALGNVIGIRSCGKPGAKRILLETHIDEVGFVVTGQRGGFLTLSNLGSIDPRLLPGTGLRVLTDPSHIGVISFLPPHILSTDEMDKVTPLSDLALDLGLTEDEAKAISPGTPVVYDTQPMPIGDGCFTGKAMDNRASFAALLLTLERLPQTLDFDLMVLASAQEELGLRGAIPGGYTAAPDLVIAMDVTFAHTPDASLDETVKLGGGAAIGIGPVLDRELSAKLTELAKAQDIPHQFEILAGKTSTTADVLHVTRAGVKTALISLPLRYMHSANELVSLRDMEAVSVLLTAFLQDFDGGGAHA